MASKYDAVYAAVQAAKLDWFDSYTGQPEFRDSANNGDRIFKYYSKDKGAGLAERKHQAEELMALLKHVPGIKKVVVRNATASASRMGYNDNGKMEFISYSWEDYDKVCVYVNIP